jgi:hypothetical protein
MNSFYEKGDGHADCRVQSVTLLCDVGSPGYRLLETAFIVRNSGTEQVRLFCDDPADAQSLLDFASRKCPQVVSRIKLRADPSY